MKKRINLKSFIVLLFALAFIANACKRDDQSRIQASWSSKDPIIIPQNVRLNELKMGNLVFNASFESGKIYYKEQNVKYFDIDGWKKIGEDIEWVNSEYENYSQSEVVEGIHAVKITRTKVDETEELGNGILSNFIKVIPGNYNLNLFVKLKDIKPNLERIGSKMYDAVNIKVFYYDKNRIEISGRECNPFLNIKVDDSFKSLSFAHFYQIKNLDWSQVIGSTAYFPFFNGDIPDKARYVKIFIGLKGTGTMWVDQVEFKYSNSNFTQLERIKPYFNSSFNPLDLIYPTPKSLVRKQQFSIYDTVNKKLPIIVIPEKPNKIHKSEAERVQKFLKNKISVFTPKINADKIEIAHIKTLKDIDSNQFIISLGNTSLYSKNKELLKDSSIREYKQSYLIQSIQNYPNIVFLNGNSENELIYAINTFLQMFKGVNYDAADIFDYPDLESRNFIVHNFEGNLDKFKSKLDLFEYFKFNSPYFEIYNENDLFYTDFDVRKIIKEKTSGIFINTNYTDLSKLRSHPYGSNVLLQENDSLEENIGLNYMTANSCKFNFEYLSKYSNLKDIHLHPIESALLFEKIESDIDFVWTGPVEYSVSIDDINIKQIIDTYKQEPILLDNSLLSDEVQLNSEYLKQYYAGKLRVKSIFEPFHFNISPRSLHKHNKVIVNTSDLTELGTIKLLTALNYYWNAKEYNPDKSLWIILNKLFGKENAINLLHFNDSYYGLIEICEKIETNGSNYKALRMAKNFESDLNNNWNLLVNGKLEKDILDELSDLKKLVENEYHKILSGDS